ncbi:thiamine-binding protein [Ilumatobacter fluminis]|uniref:thiamine-binding protein n=1 Tax=Ilumatobacter fluminis TaxID=467091 RepID=UPI0032EB1720
MPPIPDDADNIGMVGDAVSEPDHRRRTPHESDQEQTTRSFDMTHALMNIQIIPKAETPDDVYPAVESAIALVQDSGLGYEVGALGTTVEGEIDELFDLARRMNETIVAGGCRSVISQIRVYLGREPISMTSLTDRFRD